ncbi:PIR Superfamily Protein [Plasmodium malariae]|uniref:PIR Superfamily Protein n=1 Tax=Plasmodium malariae TaxID=5858 RepID=A0A1A8WT12_PLAMA|nr:PIR Superfamily Protein [Plasmodium malariae]
MESDNAYTKQINWLDLYTVLSSKINNICNQAIKKIPKYSLRKHEKLYGYYGEFNKCNGKKDESSLTHCNNNQECYNLYIENYKYCKIYREDAFCEELINFKEAYDNKMSILITCSGLPRILPPKKVEYVFFVRLTTSIVLLAPIILFLLYK